MVHCNGDRAGERAALGDLGDRWLDFASGLC
jgi:hypothetical protein